MIIPFLLLFSVYGVITNGSFTKTLQTKTKCLLVNKTYIECDVGQDSCKMNHWIHYDVIIQEANHSQGINDTNDDIVSVCGDPTKYISCDCWNHTAKTNSTISNDLCLPIISDTLDDYHKFMVGQSYDCVTNQYNDILVVYLMDPLIKKGTYTDQNKDNDKSNVKDLVLWIFIFILAAEIVCCVSVKKDSGGGIRMIIFLVILFTMMIFLILISNI